jgi:hypothetical protein
MLLVESLNNPVGMPAVAGRAEERAIAAVAAIAPNLTVLVLWESLHSELAIFHYSPAPVGDLSFMRKIRQSFNVWSVAIRQTA